MDSIQGGVKKNQHITQKAIYYSFKTVEEDKRDRK